MNKFGYLAVFVLSVGLLLPSAVATTYYVTTTGTDSSSRNGSSSQPWKTVAYAAGRVPAGDHIISVGSGTFSEKQTITLKAGVDLKGAGSGSTTIRNTSSRKATGSLGYGDNPVNYLVSVWDTDFNTISDITFKSYSSSSVLWGAIIHAGGAFADNSGLRVERCKFSNFSVNGIYAIYPKQANISNNEFTDCSTLVVDNGYSGQIRLQWTELCNINNNLIKSTTGGAYGIKLRGGNGLNVFNNEFQINGEFDLESPFEFNYGLYIYNNKLSRAISVPKQDSGDPADFGYAYTVWIHHNYADNSYGVEGPRPYMRISHNYFKISDAKQGGRILSIFGGDTYGPMTIDHNVVENQGQALAWRLGGTVNDLNIYNNVCYIKDGSSSGFYEAIVHGFSYPECTNIRVKNNVFVCHPNSQREVLEFGGASGISAANNIAINCSSFPSGSFTTDPGFAQDGAKPFPYYAPNGSGSFCVNRGTAVGYTTVGTPDIGAYEWGATSGEMLNGVYTFVARHSGKAIDVPGGSTASGTQLEQWVVDGTSSQTWKVENIGAGAYKILSLYSGLAMDISGGSTANGASLVQWPYLGGQNQQFYLEHTGGGSLRIKARHSGLVLDVIGASQSDGADIQQYGDGGGTNQRWRPDWVRFIGREGTTSQSGY